MKKIILFFITLLICSPVFAQEKERFFIRDGKPDLYIDDFTFHRTRSGVQVWTLKGKNAWVFEKSNKVELYNGYIEIYNEQQSKFKTEKSSISFLHCLFDKTTNELVLNDNVKMTVFSDTNLILETSELQYNGENTVKNNVKNKFTYGKYIARGTGLNYSSIENMLTLQSDVRITDNEKNFINSVQAVIYTKTNTFNLTKVKEAMFENNFFKSEFCQLKNKQLFLKDKIEIKNKDYSLFTESADYDLTTKKINLHGEFVLKNDTGIFQGSNLLINYEKNQLASDDRGTLDYSGYKINFDKIQYADNLMKLTGNIRVSKSAETFETSRIFINMAQMRNIQKIYTDTYCLIKRTNGFVAETLGFEAEFKNNDFSTLFLNDKIKIIMTGAEAVANRATLSKDTGGFDLLRLTNGVSVRNNMFEFKTSECTGFLVNGKISKLYAANSLVVIESDTYIMKSDNFLVDFPLNTDAFDISIVNGVDIFSKFNATKLFGSSMIANIRNNKITNLSLKEKIKGLIVNTKKKT